MNFPFLIENPKSIVAIGKRARELLKEHEYVSIASPSIGSLEFQNNFLNINKIRANKIKNKKINYQSSFERKSGTK
jgi:hypothetical protein